MLEYVRQVDLRALAAADSAERFSQRLLTAENGAENIQVLYIRTPPGSGTRIGLHTHDIEQVFFLISGRMHYEINGIEGIAEPGSLIIFPAGIPHRNWSEEETYHLAIMAPLKESAGTRGHPVTR